MKTWKAWNGNNWETFKTFKATCKMLQERYNLSTLEEQKDMDNEEIYICTGNVEYCYATVEIILGDFAIRVFKEKYIFF